MKYIEIFFDRVVELYRHGESSRAFILCTNGDLERLDSKTYFLDTFIHKLQYFEQIEEVHNERD
jgi:predicted transcriptional regulator YheO